MNTHSSSGIGFFQDRLKLFIRIRHYRKGKPKFGALVMLYKIGVLVIILALW